MANEEKRYKIESEIVKVLKNIYDPEIPVNIYNLGLIYEIKLNNDFTVDLTMTLTTPNCPIADDLVSEVKRSVSIVEGVKEANINLVFDPPWDQSMLTDEAKLALGML